MCWGPYVSNISLCKICLLKYFYIFCNLLFDHSTINIVVEFCFIYNVRIIVFPFSILHIIVFYFNKNKIRKLNDIGFSNLGIYFLFKFILMRLVIKIFVNTPYNNYIPPLLSIKCRFENFHTF